MRRNSGGLAADMFRNLLAYRALRILLIGGMGANYCRAIDLVFDGCAEILWGAFGAGVKRFFVFLNF